MSSADFIERRWLRDFGSMHRLQENIVDELRTRGARHMRMSYQEFTGQVIGEGWRERPKDEGELPL